MIAYFDTSAIVKLLVREPGSESALEVWSAASARLAAVVGRPELAAALTRAVRMQRIAASDLDGLWRRFERAWAGTAHLPVDEALADRASVLALVHGLRGFDAIHLAAATASADTLVAADQDLLTAARREGLATVDVAA